MYHILSHYITLCWIIRYDIIFVIWFLLSNMIELLLNILLHVFVYHCMLLETTIIILIMHYVVLYCINIYTHMYIYIYIHVHQHLLMYYILYIVDIVLHYLAYRFTLDCIYIYKTARFACCLQQPLGLCGTWEDWQRNGHQPHQGESSQVRGMVSSWC